MARLRDLDPPPDESEIPSIPAAWLERRIHVLEVVDGGMPRAAAEKRARSMWESLPSSGREAHLRNAAERERQETRGVSDGAASTS